jgi:tetratricopeptide (TPR) repeat protein
MGAHAKYWGPGGFIAALTLALSGPSGVCAAPSAGPVRVHVNAYAGRFEDHPRFGPVFGDLDAEVRKSLAAIEQALGLAPGNEGRIHVFVRDAADRPRSTDRARCYTRTVGGEEFHRVELYAEYFLSGDSEHSIVLTHELVHAVMRERMGRRDYERLPYWIREGLAVHAAGEGRGHLRRTLIATQDPDELLTGLMGRVRSLQMYPYAYLGVSLIEAKGGDGALRRFVQGLLAGEHPRAVIHRITGLAWSDYLKALRHFARARIEEEATGLAEIRAALRNYRRGRFARARSAFEAFTRTHAASAFAATARYYVARCWFRTRRYAEASAAFSDCIEQDLGHSGWIDECFLYLGISLHEQERDAEAIAALTDFVDFHAYSSQRDLGYLALGRALKRVGRAAGARDAFEHVDRMRRARSSNRRAARRELAALDAPADRPTAD